MTEKSTNLALWIARVQQADSAKRVYKTLDEFRPGPWSDEDRAKMAKAYMRVLERVGTAPPEAETLDAAAGDESDGPVWYEKM